MGATEQDDNQAAWAPFKHYILTFHDSMSECIAKGFELREEKNSVQRQTEDLLHGIAAEHL